MKPRLHSVPQGTPRPVAAPGFSAVILRLVRNAPEREAIAAGQVDAVIDPASGEVILLPDAQQALLQHQARVGSLLALTADWLWEQDAHYCFVAQTSTVTGQAAPFAESMLGKAPWELGWCTAPGFEWETHRQQLAWCVSFRDLELGCAGGADAVRWFSIDGEPVYDADDQFTGYRGTMRDVTQRNWSQGLALAQSESAARALKD